MIDKIIAENPLMRRLLVNLHKIAQSHASVFISGESGTGKEVIAQAIHTLSPRNGAPFIKVNCAAIPEPLIESEFFGHEKGAFTGAITRRIGRFELADRGTLLLDEVSETPLSVQSKLLRAVQEQEFERVGGTHPINVNVRILATSNLEMKKAIQKGIFREDLFYRLNVIPIHLPPLRDRREDIVPLAIYFLEKFGEKQVLSADAKKALEDYSFPGNIRELANMIERTAVLTSDKIIGPRHLNIEQANPTKRDHRSLKEVERQHILKTLAALGDNRTKTAHALGISIRTLRNKLSEYSNISL